MTWCGELLLVALAQGGDSVPPGLEAKVRSAVAERWQVASAAVALNWGRLASRDPIADTAGFRLVGRGDEGRWVVMVRTGTSEIAIGLRAGVRDSLWVAVRPLGLGTTIGPGDLARAERVTWGPPRPDAEAPLGWEVRRSLAPGDPVAPPAVVEPPLIRSGETVRFVWRGGTISVAREGIAANTARRGETVWARDRLRGDRLVGVATGRGVARLEGGHR